MRNNKGITMMALTITIVVMFILSTMTINISFDAYHVIKVQNFVAKMKVIQSKVDNFVEETGEVEEYPFTEVPNIEVLTKIIESDTIDKTHSWVAEVDSNPDNYYYFTPHDLEEKLGLKSQDMAVFINFQTRNVISEKGVKKDGKVYYRQYDLEGGEQLQ